MFITEKKSRLEERMVSRISQAGFKLYDNLPYETEFTAKIIKISSFEKEKVQLDQCFLNLTTNLNIL